MIRRSQKAEQNENASLKARFTVNGQIDRSAVSAFAQSEAARLFPTGNVIYKDQAEMAAGFEAEFLARIASA